MKAEFVLKTNWLKECYKLKLQIVDQSEICIGNNMIYSDIWHKDHE